MAHDPNRFRFFRFPNRNHDGIAVGDPVLHRLSEVKTTKILTNPDNPFSDTVFQTKTEIRETCTTTSHLQPLPVHPGDAAAHQAPIPSNYPFVQADIAFQGNQQQVPQVAPPAPVAQPAPVQPANGQPRHRPPGHFRYRRTAANAAPLLAGLERQRRIAEARAAQKRARRNNGTPQDPIYISEESETEHDADDEQ